MKSRTSAYRFTVQMQNGKPTPEYAHMVESLRQQIAIENNQLNTKRYVKLQGRGHRRGVFRYHQSLPLSLASSADVYVYIR
jgi:hypothetical protein